MNQRNRTTIESSEVSFFAEVYKNESYNPTGNNLRLNRELESIKKLSGLKQFKKVLSIGCGDGEFERLLSPYAEHITAVDISPEAIDLAKKKSKSSDINNINFRCQSVSELKLDEQFDAIICLAFLHHVREEDLPEFFKKVYEHLEPDGFFYSQDPNINGVLRKIGRIILRKNYDKYHTPDERELNPKEIVNLLKQTGFNFIKINNIDLTLIPALYMFTKNYSWLMNLCYWIDWVWCRSPFAPFASGFAMISWKKNKSLT